MGLEPGLPEQQSDVAGKLIEGDICTLTLGIDVYYYNRTETGWKKDKAYCAIYPRNLLKVVQPGSITICEIVELGEVFVGIWNDTPVIKQ